MSIEFNDEYFMSIALKEAELAFKEGEIPVGAIVTCNDQIIARSHNLTERLNDVTAHAEIQAITAAAEYLNSKYLKECTLYVTLEPCIMCAGALAWSQIPNIVIGASDDKKGYRSYSNKVLHPKTKVITGVREIECSNLMKAFFQAKRK